MRLICPSCSSQYNVDASLFPEEGREVQCAQCENKWVQYPQPEPVQLTQPVAPSSRLPQSERDSIQSAIREEISIHEQDSIDAKEEEEDLMRSLREQLANDTGDYDSAPDDERVSGRRSVSRAADMAGVAIEDEQPEERKMFKGGARDDSKTNELAAALQEYERERGPRRGSKFGFTLSILLAALAVGAYFGRDQIATQYPPALPYLEKYVEIVDVSRDEVVKYWGITSAFVTEKIDAAMAAEPVEAVVAPATTE